MINETQFVLVEVFSLVRARMHACMHAFKSVYIDKGIVNLGESSVEMIDSGMATYPE